MNEDKYYLIAKPQEGPKNKILLCKTDDIQSVYLLDLFSSSAVTFQISTPQQILLQASVTRVRLVSGEPKLKVVLISPDTNYKVVLLFSLNEIRQSNSSLRSCYSILHRL